MNVCKRHRFPPDIISYTVWLHHRFNLSHRDIEDLLAQRGVTVSHESIRLWCIKFGPEFAKRLWRKHQGSGDTFYVDAEHSHEETRFRERGMKRFKSAVQAQRFLGVHSAVYNLFNLGRHMVRARHYRDLRRNAFASWIQVTAA